MTCGETTDGQHFENILWRMGWTVGDSHQSRSCGVGSPFWLLFWRSIVLVLGSGGS